MAVITKLQAKYNSSVWNPPSFGTYYSNASEIELTISGYTQSSTNRYKFIVSGDSQVGGSLNCAVYKNSTFQYNRTIQTPFGDGGFTVLGSYSNIIDGITINTGTPEGIGVNVTEDVNINAGYYSGGISYDTIDVGDLFESNGTDNIYKVVYRDAGGDHTVYQDQLPQPNTPTYISKTSSSIKWRYYIPSTAQENVNIVAKLDKSPKSTYRTIATNRAPNTSFDYTWTSLYSSTSYYTTYYLVPYAFTGLQNSVSRNSSSITTLASSGGTDWDYQYENSAAPSTYDAYFIGTAATSSEAYDELFEQEPPSTYTIGDIAVYERDGFDIYWVFECI